MSERREPARAAKSGKPSQRREPARAAKSGKPSQRREPARAAKSGGHGGLPLAGVRVVESVDELGELGGRLLADLGADVVRIEPPGGASSRRLPPWHDGESLSFAVRNANKRRLTADLATEDGRHTLHALLAEADIWIDGHRPGRLESLGLTPSTVLAELPHLVITSITDFGQSGPYRDFEATDPVLVAMSGCLYRAGIPELPPVLPPGRMAHDVAGIVTAFAALVGYWQRLATGRGQHLDVSAFEANAQTIDWGLATFSVAGASVAYGEVRSGAGPVYPLVPCADGFVRPSIVTPAEWTAMRAWMGLGDHLAGDEWSTASARASIRDELLELYRAFFADKTKVALAEEGQRRRMTITPLLDLQEVLAAPHFAELGSFTAAGDGLVPSGFLEVDGERAGWRDWCGEHDRWRERPVLRRGPAAAGARPFQGLRVLDFGVAGAAPEVGRLFAEYGADVITVESRDHPDLFRIIMGTDFSPPFVSSNRSKRSIGVDARHPDARAVLEALIAASDVIVENLPYGSMDRLHLGWDDIERINPAIVMISSQLMGTRGRWKEWRGYGANTQPVAGLTWLWSYPGLDRPVGANVALPDHVVGRLGAVAAVAGLVRRLRTQRGGHVEIAQVEVILNLLADTWAQATLEPGRVAPAGNRSERGAPWGVYPCAGDQRWCVITCRDDEEWARLRGAMGDPGWAGDPCFADAAGRRSNHDALDARVAAWTSTRSDREVMEQLQAHHVAAGMMMYPSDHATDPHLRERGYVCPLDQPGIGPMLVEGPAFHGTELDAPFVAPAPRLGEHTREICTGLLGLDPSKIDALIVSGALFAAD